MAYTRECATCGTEYEPGTPTQNICGKPRCYVALLDRGDYDGPAYVDAEARLERMGFKPAAWLAKYE